MLFLETVRAVCEGIVADELVRFLRELDSCITVACEDSWHLPAANVTSHFVSSGKTTSVKGGQKPLSPNSVSGFSPSIVP